MQYRPRDYWTWRPLVKGPEYVGPGSKPDLNAAERGDFVATLEQYLPSPKPGLTLDFGCGSGRLAPNIARHSEPYLGVDISPTGIQQAQRMHPELHFIWMPQDHIPLPNQTVKTVVASVVFQHIVHDRDWAIWTKELKRVLCPGGRVFVIDNLPVDHPHTHMKPRDPMKVAMDLNLSCRKQMDLEEHWFGLFR